MSEKGVSPAYQSRAGIFAVCWNWCLPPSFRNKSGNVSVHGRLWGFLGFTLRECRNIPISSAWCSCVYIMGFSRAVAHVLPVCSWNQWGNKHTSAVHGGRESSTECSKGSLFLCRKSCSCPVRLWSGLGLTDVVAGFVAAVISVCVLNSKGKFDLNQPWSHIIKANEQVPICIKVSK